MYTLKATINLYNRRLCLVEYFVKCVQGLYRANPCCSLIRYFFSDTKLDWDNYVIGLDTQSKNAKNLFQSVCNLCEKLHVKKSNKIFLIPWDYFKLAIPLSFDSIWYFRWKEKREKLSISIEWWIFREFVLIYHRNHISCRWTVLFKAFILCGIRYNYIVTLIVV